MLRRKPHPPLPLPAIEESGGGVGKEGEATNKRSQDYEITDGGNSNMKVVVRVRPENEMEIRSNCETVIKVLDDHVLVFDPKDENMHGFDKYESGKKRRHLLSRKRKDLHFAFDRVFDETSSQNEVFLNTTKSIIDGLLDGVNCSVFAYGATGAGKTHTMLGSSEKPGVMFLTTMELYRRIEELKHEKNCLVAVSYLEVYNEMIRDLLAPSGPLAIREDAHKGLVVSGLSQHQPTSAEELLEMLDNGNKNRTQHPTDANATSSRSHAVFQVFVNQKPRSAGLSAEVTQGKMSLIDLAGSERATVTTNRGARLREGANINKSLLALGNCINALASNKGKTGHVPYRNSKLTRLLKDSLGGNCRTVMIANISPSSLTYEDTYNTLKYADRAKQIKTKLVRNVVNVDFHVTRYRAIVIELQKEITDLKTKLDISGHPTFDTTEAGRLQTLVHGVYNERGRLRKTMADLDAAERDTLLRIFRKERDLQRVELLTGNDDKIAKIKCKIEYLHGHLKNVKERKTEIHQGLSQNNEQIGRVQSEISSSVAIDAAGAAVIRNHIDLVTEARKLEAENAHQWKQTKHLLKYIKNQEKDISRTEKILALSLELVNKQHQLLQATNSQTPVIKDLYQGMVRLVDGEKEVAWIDQSQDSLFEISVSSLTQTQQALFDTINTQNSPLRRPGGSRYSSPSNSASLGLLTVTIPTVYTTRSQSPISKSPTLSPSLIKPCSPHPLSTRLVATPTKSNSSSLTSSTSPLQQLVNGGCLSGKVLSVPIKSPRRNRQVAFSHPSLTIQEKEESTDFEDRNNIKLKPQTDTKPIPKPDFSLGQGLEPSRPPPSRAQSAVNLQTRSKQISFKEEEKTTQSDKIPKAISVTSTSRHIPSTPRWAQSQINLSSSESPRTSSPSGKLNGYRSYSPKTRINLAELTSINQNSLRTQSPSSIQPIAPVAFDSPPMNAFEDNFISSYPVLSKPVNYTPLNKSLSVGNPMYLSNDSLPLNTHTPSRHLPMPTTNIPMFPSSSHNFQSGPIPPYPVYPMSHGPFTNGVTLPFSPVVIRPQKPAFLPVAVKPSSKGATKRNDYRSPVNIPIQPLPSMGTSPPQPPSFLKSSQSAFQNTLDIQRQQSQPVPTSTKRDTSPKTSSVTSVSSQTQKSHRYSLISPTLPKVPSVLSKEKEDSGGLTKSDNLNSTFTISSSSYSSGNEKQKTVIFTNNTQSQPTTDSHMLTQTINSTGKGIRQKKSPPNVLKPLSTLQVGSSGSLEPRNTRSGSTSSSSSSGEKKQPNYLALTKSATFKRVQQTGQTRNHKENHPLATNKTQSTCKMIKGKTSFVSRTFSNRSHSVSSAS